MCVSGDVPNPTGGQGKGSVLYKVINIDSIQRPVSMTHVLRTVQDSVPGKKFCVMKQKSCLLMRKCIEQNRH